MEDIEKEVSYPSTAVGTIGNCSFSSPSNRTPRLLRPVQAVPVDLVQVTVEVEVVVVVVVGRKSRGSSGFTTSRCTLSP